MKRIDNKEVGMRLEDIRMEKRYRSVRSFALALNCDPSLFSKIIKGERSISESLLETLTDKFNVSEDWILYGQNPKYGQNIPQRTFSKDSQNEAVSQGINYQDRLISTLENHNTFLQNLVNSSLIRLSDVQQLILAEVKAVHQYEAKKQGQRHKGKEKQIEKQVMQDISKLVSANLPEEMKKDNLVKAGI